MTVSDTLDHIDIRHFSRSVGNGGDDTAALQWLVDESNQRGIIGVIPPGVEIVASGVTSPGTVRLNGYGSKITQARDEPVLSVLPTWAPVPASIALVDYTFPWNTNSETVTQVSTGLSCDPGDWIKVVADDPIVGAGNPNKRTGQVFQVVHVDAGSLIVAGQPIPEDSYTTNVRVAKVPDSKVELRGLTVNSPISGEVDGWDSALIVVSSSIVDAEDLSCDFGAAHFLRLRGCHHFDVSSVRVRRLLDTAPPDLRIGYGVVAEGGSQYGTVSELIAGECRHAFTTNTLSANAGSGSIEAFGRAAFISVADSVGSTSRAAAFDTHPGAWDISFDNCKAVNGLPSRSGRSVGFSFRGRGVKAKNCSAENLRLGFFSLNTEDEDMGDHHLVGCETRNVEVGYRVQSNEFPGQATVMRVDSCDFEATDNAFEIIDSDLDVSDTRSALVGPKSPAWAVIVRGQSTLRFDGGVVDGRRHTGADTRGFEMSGAASLVMRNTRWAGTSFDRMFFGTNTHSGSVDAINLDVDNPPNVLETAIASHWVTENQFGVIDEQIVT